MVRTTIRRAVRAARWDHDDIDTPLPNRVGSDDCDATVDTSRVLVNDIAERIALDGDLFGPSSPRRLASPEARQSRR
jgi:hypothetical protein